MDTPTADLDLARILERAEANANAAFVEARALIDPSVGAHWTEVAGVYAMYDGVSSPLTQTFGLGLFAPFMEPEFARVESFFRVHAAPTLHEVSSFAAPATTALLEQRGYKPVEASVVLVRPTSPAVGGDASGQVSVRLIDESECEQWAHVSALGWGSESPELIDFVESLGLVSARARGVHCFLAEIDGEAVGASALSMSPGVALLAGASTIPSARRRGVQRAFLETRLAFAAARGVALAMIVTQPDSASQRNAERQGFRAVYTRVKWGLDQTTASAS